MHHVVQVHRFSPLPWWWCMYRNSQTGISQAMRTSRQRGVIGPSTSSMGIWGRRRPSIQKYDRHLIIIIIVCFNQNERGQNLTTGQGITAVRLPRQTMELSKAVSAEAVSKMVIIIFLGNWKMFVWLFVSALFLVTLPCLKFHHSTL